MLPRLPARPAHRWPTVFAAVGLEAELKSIYKGVLPFIMLLMVFPGIALFLIYTMG
jgi:hypothetical protein